MERGVESVLERWQSELDNAGVNLADEGADADCANHHPGV